MAAELWDRAAQSIISNKNPNGRAVQGQFAGIIGQALQRLVSLQCFIGPRPFLLSKVPQVVDHMTGIFIESNARTQHPRAPMPLHPLLSFTSAIGTTMANRRCSSSTSELVCEPCSPRVCHNSARRSPIRTPLSSPTTKTPAHLPSGRNTRVWESRTELPRHPSPCAWRALVLGCDHGVFDAAEGKAPRHRTPDLGAARVRALHGSTSKLSLHVPRLRDRWPRHLFLWLISRIGLQSIPPQLKPISPRTPRRYTTSLTSSLLPDKSVDNSCLSD